MGDTLFQPLQSKNLEMKNRIICSNVGDRFDSCDGSGNLARINRESKFPRGWVGVMVASFFAGTARGRIALADVISVHG